MTRTDVASPTAVIFVDALGETLPWKSSFSFKELSDFCHREGVVHLAGKNSLSETELLTIAKKIEIITKGHIAITSKPLQKTARNRTPLSKIDMDVAHHVANYDETFCERCGTRTPLTKFCDGCRDIQADVLFGKPSLPEYKRKKKKQSIDLGAAVVLHNGARVHVVEKNGATYVGVDDAFDTHTFSLHEAVEVNNLTDPIEKQANDSCPVCGEPMMARIAKCNVCGYDREVTAEGINWGGI